MYTCVCVYASSTRVVETLLQFCDENVYLTGCGFWSGSEWYTCIIITCATLRHFLSISLDEHQSPMDHILLLCTITVCTKLTCCTRIVYMLYQNSLHKIELLREPHTCGENGKLSIYIYIYMYIYMYIWYVRIPYMYTSCPICARCNISTLHAGSCNHCCSRLTRDKTSRKERLNVGTSVTGT